MCKLKIQKDRLILRHILFAIPNLFGLLFWALLKFSNELDMEEIHTIGSLYVRFILAMRLDHSFVLIELPLTEMSC